MLAERGEQADWVVERRRGKKTILTVFGPVECERTSYKHKKEKRYVHFT